VTRHRNAGWCAPVALAVILASPGVLADDQSIDAGVTQSWIVMGTTGEGTNTKSPTLPTTGISLRWLFLDGRGEVAMGGRLNVWKPLWKQEKSHENVMDNYGVEALFEAQFSGRFKDRKVNIMPCGGMSIGLANFFLDAGVLDASRSGRIALSGLGLDAFFGLHGYFGKRSGFYYRLVGHAKGYLLFPQAGWMGGGGIELTIGVYLD